MTPTPAVAAVPVATSSPLPQSAEDKARAALNQLRATEPVVAAVPAVAPPARSPKQGTAASKVAPAAKSEPTAPAVAAAPPVATTKKEKLQEILELYIADQITAREYHDRRATILAGN